jgi:hypothetical protein
VVIVGSEALQRADGGAVISLVQQIADKAKVQVRSQYFLTVLWLWWAGPREMENISRGSTFRDFLTIGIESSMQDITVERLQSTGVQTPLSPLF